MHKRDAIRHPMTDHGLRDLFGWLIALAFVAPHFLVALHSAHIDIRLLSTIWIDHQFSDVDRAGIYLLNAMADHHFEQSGWKETQVVVRFWIITMMLVLFGLSTLKLR